MLGNITADLLHHAVFLLGTGAVQGGGHMTDERPHGVDIFHPAAIKFQSLRLLEHGVETFPVLFQRIKKHLHIILIKALQSGSVQLTSCGQAIQQLKGLLFSGRGVALLKQTLPAGDLGVMEGRFRPCLLLGLGPKNAALEGYVGAASCCQGLPQPGRPPERLGSAGVERRGEVEIMFTGTLEISQPAGQSLAVQLLLGTALERQCQTMGLRHGAN